ncbi:multi-sensor hybrid histidine kinase [Desulfurivibrio alkaliphilus AHT 2]|uniref:histidine kinase n=2 Tax=Desulfurivibrio alkaliphilus TaxID=427923 RepID=D6Z3A3_DESAT|nr:multi-sensor hybrid histidine kinase [Desulfurivibrio alkaliphilus AHT 2]
MFNSLFGRIFLAALVSALVAVLLTVLAVYYLAPPGRVVWVAVLLAVAVAAAGTAWLFSAGIRQELGKLAAWLGDFVGRGDSRAEPPAVGLADWARPRQQLRKLFSWQQEILDICWAAREGKLDRRLPLRSPQDQLTPAFNGLLDDLNQANLSYAEAISYLHAIPTPVQVVDRELNIRFINQAGARAARLAAGQCIGKKCHEIFHTRDCNSDRCKVIRAMIQNRTLTGENISITARGEAPYRYTAAPLKDENGRIVGAVEYIVDIRDEVRVVEMAEAIAQGRYDFCITPRSEDDRLSHALNQMASTLKQLEASQEESRWLNEGVAAVSDRLHGEHDQLSLAHNVLEALVEVLDVPVAAFYLAQDEDTLRLLKVYGGSSASGEAGARTAVHRDEGLVGRALQEGRLLVVNDLPPGYLKISSGLGEVDATAVAVLPVYFETELRCVLELGTHRAFAPREEELLRRVMENIGVALHTTEVRYELARLLETTQEQSEKLQVQQEELRQTNAELQEQARALAASEERLQVQQEELRVSNEELEERSRSLAEKNRELQKARQELEEKARALEISGRYKSEFLANMSHELRTPLNSILILSQMLATNKQGNLLPRQLEYATTINNSGSDLLNLINEVLDLSKIEAGRMDINPETVNLKALLDSLLHPFRPLAEEKQLTLVGELADDLPVTIYSDETRLGQILKNLLSNALKFTAEGEVKITIGRPENDKLPPGLKLNPARTLVFQVRDTGIGIAADKLEVVFEAFKQADGTTSRKFGGTGLGLSISRQLARLLGGELTAASRAGEGSVFTLWLPERLELRVEAGALPGPSLPGGSPLPKDDQGLPPAPARSVTAGAATRPEDVAAASPSPPALPEEISAKRAADIPAPEAAEPPPQAPDALVRDDRRILSREDKSLLIIEDDSSFASLLLELARDKGYKGLVAEDGETGLHLADYFRPSGIILDMGLPGISGREVMERLKKNPETRHIPVHFISASDPSNEVMQLGAVGFLTKPVSVDKLEQVFGRIEKLAENPVKRLLVVEDDMVQRQAIRAMVGEGGDIEVVEAADGEEAHRLLGTEHFDCVILDLGLGDMSGFDLLTKIKDDQRISQVPVVIYTGREISPDEEERLQQYADSIIIKGARSPERLLDETTLFLHRVEKSLPSRQQEVLKTLHNRESAFQGRTVLLVDDDMRNIFALSSVLEEAGLEIVVARDGREALAKLAEHPEIDLVLMDIMMPEMDGYEAMGEIRRDPARAKLPIIALTAKAMRGDKDKCLAAGANDYLAKPVDPERLLSLLRVWLYQ